MPNVPKKRRVLVAEDEKPMAHALEAKLSKFGYDVTIANDGEKAMELLKQDTYGLLILDIMMPKKNGFDVLEWMQKENISVPVIVSSNLGQGDDIKNAMKLGAKDYFVKSETPIAEIVERVQKIFP